VDQDPLVCYGEMRVFMCLLGVACDTFPAPSEEGPCLLPTLLLLMCVDSFDASLLLLGQCIGLRDTVPLPPCSSSPGDACRPL
jgi:hypothetical protein